MAKHFGIVLLAALALAGCTAVKQTFPGHDAERVWNAMVVVAEQPHYDDWTLRNNYVMADDVERRIEIDRRIERTLREPGTKPWVEKHRWQFTVRLVETEPPKAKFIVRSTAIPAHAKAEARRYFEDVLDLLGGRRTASPDE